MVPTRDAAGARRAEAELAGLLLFSSSLAIERSGQGRVVCSPKAARSLERLAVNVTRRRLHPGGWLELEFRLDPLLVGRSGILGGAGDIVFGLPARLVLGTVQEAEVAVIAAFHSARAHVLGRGQGWFVPCTNHARALGLVGLLRRTPR